MLFTAMDELDAPLRRLMLLLLLVPVAAPALLGALLESNFTVLLTLPGPLFPIPETVLRWFPAEPFWAGSFAIAAFPTLDDVFTR